MLVPEKAVKTWAPLSAQGHLQIYQTGYKSLQSNIQMISIQYTIVLQLLEID